jgi:two-component system sensor histidine kinase AlgZ
VDIHVFPETRDAAVPSMVLQPLVENAVRHGVAPSIEGGDIVIETMVLNDCLVMTVRNSAPRIDSASTRDDKRSNGIGLTNTAERLRTLYGESQRFTARSLAGGRYEVIIKIPFRKVSLRVEGAVCAR